MRFGGGEIGVVVGVVQRVEILEECGTGGGGECLILVLFVRVDGGGGRRESYGWKALELGEADVEALPHEAGHFLF